MIHLELRRTGVTLRLLHEEYLAANPLGAYGYTKFVELYNTWADRLKVTMRQVHKAGEKCESCGHDHSHTQIKLGQTILGLILVLNSYVVEWIFPGTTVVADFSAMAEMRRR